MAVTIKDCDPHDYDFDPNKCDWLYTNDCDFDWHYPNNSDFILMTVIDFTQMTVTGFA